MGRTKSYTWHMYYIKNIVPLHALEKYVVIYITLQYER